MKISKFAAVAASVILLAGCRGDGYRISGDVEGADKENTILLEKADPNGAWFALDSVSLDGGSFSFKGEAPEHSEIMRLRLGDAYIYLPVDSAADLSVKTTLKDFGRDFTVAGTEEADAFNRFEQRLRAVAPHMENADSMAAFKRRVYNEFLKDARGSLTSYYVLTKIVDGKPLYDAAEDYRFFAAVATGFREFRPDDPRATLLENVAREGMRQHNLKAGNKRVLQAEEIDILEITLPDERGENASLSSAVGKGQPVALVFANLRGDGAPELIMKLRGLHERGTKIYQVSFDQDQHAWRETAVNLPWTTVWASDVNGGAKTAVDYNVQELPTYYIYNRDGQLAARAENFESLASQLSGY